MKVNQSIKINYHGKSFQASVKIIGLSAILNFDGRTIFIKNNIIYIQYLILHKKVSTRNIFFLS